MGYNKNAASNITARDINSQPYKLLDLANDLLLVAPDIKIHLVLRNPASF